MAFKVLRRSRGNPTSDSQQSRQGDVARYRTRSRPHARRWALGVSEPGQGIRHVQPGPCTGSRQAAAVAAGATWTAAPLQLGNLSIQTPLALAPMAGITNAPFRMLCAKHGAGLCVSELIIASTLLQRTPAALQLARWAPEEQLRSAQLYASRPEDMHQATQALVRDFGVSHVDINFGCPVRKITSRGGGAAIPLKPALFASLVRAAVAGAGGEPVTVKMRLGVSPEMETFLEAGRIAALEGAAAVVLHARYADQLYAPPVHWQGIAALAERLPVPVVGNGDVFTAGDALQMMAVTGAQGVMIGRACLGRPWVFAEVAAAMRGEEAPPRARLRDAVTDMQEHVHGLADWEGSERKAVLQMRKFVPLYLNGFQSATELQSALMRCHDLTAWDRALQTCPHNVDECPASASDTLPRLKGGTHGATKRIVLPDGWLNDDYDVATITDIACEG